MNRDQVHESRSCVFPDWFFDLPMQQQSVLVLAARGPDGVAKHHQCKPIVREYRAVVFKAAYLGRELMPGEALDTFMHRNLTYREELWKKVVREFFEHSDSLPHHYLLHLAHGSEIIGYKHPHKFTRHAWLYLYWEICRDMHVTPETEEELDNRLSDGFRENWSKEVS